MGSGRVSLPQKGTKNVPQIGTPYPSKLVCLISPKNGSGRVSLPVCLKSGRPIPLNTPWQKGTKRMVVQKIFSYRGFGSTFLKGGKKLKN